MSFRRLALASLLSPLLAIAASAADTKKPVWDPTRTTAPDTLDEAKALQDTVKDLVAKVTPATVALIVGGDEDEKEKKNDGPKQVGAGSGVIVSTDGLVLTAAHVVEPPVFDFGGFNRRRDAKTPTSVRLLLPGNIEVKGKILGRNSDYDSGMVKITDPVPEGAKWPGAKEGKWPAVELGDSTKLKKGQWVVSLGHPGGPKPDRRAPVRLGQIVATAEGRSQAVRSDCTLVGGDSGGPLFDLTGKLVGIHSRIGEKLDDNIHVPAKAYQDEWKRLVRGDSISRGTTAFMGVKMDSDVKSPPRIDEFADNSPAEKAGLKPGDLIIKFNGNAVGTIEDYEDLLTQVKPGETATLLVRRGDETLEAKVTLGSLRGRRRQP